MLLFLLSVLLVLTNACDCITSLEGITNYSNFPMYSNYSYQWMYYLLNDGVTSNTMLFLLKNSNNNCNSTTDTYYYRLFHRNLKHNTFIEWEDTLNSNSVNGDNFGVYMPSIQSLAVRIPNVTYIRGSNYSLTIKDGLGIYPQGTNGFVYNGEWPCQTSYSYSLPKVEYVFNYNNTDYSGIGYGEYISGSLMQYPKEYSGWHCHYIHITNYSGMICSSYKINGAIDPYGKGLFIHNDTLERTWLVYTDFSMQDTLSYKGYKIGWSIQIPILNISLQLTPVLQDQFISYAFTTAWQGTIQINGSHEGIGFSEIVHL